MSRPYHINQHSAIYSDLNTILRTLGEYGTVSIFKKPDDSRWVLTTQGKVFEDLSMNRVIERAGRALTTVYDR